MIFGATIIFGMTCTSPSLASDNLLQETLTICADLGQDRDAVDRRLTALGWAAGDTSEATANLLFWTVFARDFSIYDNEGLRLAANSEDFGKQLGYLVANASFMSASILGNSALPPEQPNYAHEQYLLAVLGVSLGKGYCIFAGPGSIADEARSVQGVVEQWPENLPRSNRSGVSSFFAETGSSVLFAAVLDEVALRSLYASADIELPYTKSEFDPRIFDETPEAILQISPKQR